MFLSKIVGHSTVVDAITMTYQLYDCISRNDQKKADDQRHTAFGESSNQGKPILPVGSLWKEGREFLVISVSKYFYRRHEVFLSKNSNQNGNKLCCSEFCGCISWNTKWIFTSISIADHVQRDQSQGSDL